MTTRAALVALAAALALAPAGCRKPPASAAIPGTGPAPPAAVAAPTVDYRTLPVPQLEMLIRDKTGSPITLTAAGPNKYRGTRPSPDGTVQVPVEVTVEAERIVITTTGGGLTAQDVITPRGLEVGNPR